ncbi:MAG: hypothetical protein ACOH2H_14365 [Cypionkella sp.]
MAKLTAVLTGDLIGSTEAEPSRVETSMSTLLDAATRVTPDNRFTRFRGDGWQVFLAEPRHFLSAAVYMHARLKADTDRLATRISIGLGTAEHLGDETGLGGASGTAFINSGRALDNKLINGGNTLLLSGEGTDDIQRSVLAFVEDRIQGWSREQAQVIAMKLTPDESFTQEQMSEHLGISRQAVGARLQTAGWPLIHRACTAFHDHFAERA